MLFVNNDGEPIIDVLLPCRSYYFVRNVALLGFLLYVRKKRKSKKKRMREKNEEEGTYFERTRDRMNFLITDPVEKKGC